MESAKSKVQKDTKKRMHIKRVMSNDLSMSFLFKRNFLKYFVD